MKIVNAEKKLVDDLVEECTETGSEVEMAKKTSAEYKNGCKSSSTTYIVFFFNNLYNQHWNWYLFCLFPLVKKDVTPVWFDTYTQTTI